MSRNIETLINKMLAPCLLYLPAFSLIYLWILKESSFCWSSSISAHFKLQHPSSASPHCLRTSLFNCLYPDSLPFASLLFSIASRMLSVIHFCFLAGFAEPTTVYELSTILWLGRIWQSTIQHPRILTVRGCCVVLLQQILLQILHDCRTLCLGLYFEDA